jgi:archaellum component FlaD/FlaE
MSRTTAARASLFWVAGMVSERLRMFLKGIRAPTPTPRMEPASSARYRG